MRMEIEDDRRALLGVLVVLCAMLGSCAGTLPRRLHRAGLRILRPAEWAARRLIIAVAEGLKPPPVKPRPPKPRAASSFVASPWSTGIYIPHAARRAMRAAGVPDPRHPDAGNPDTGNPDGNLPDTGNPDGTRPDIRMRSLPMLDPLGRLRRSPRILPRIRDPNVMLPAATPQKQPPRPTDPLDARRLGLRIAAIRAALDDLPRRALRFARWREAHRLPVPLPPRRPGGPKRFTRTWPLARRLPGGKAKATQDVLAILGRVNDLAVLALVAPDSS
jgi:hypothetical protein